MPLDLGASASMLSPLRLILVEDSKIIQARLVEALEEIQHVTIVAKVDTQREATAILSSREWDIVILDLQLKEGTGLGVLKSLSIQGRKKNSKIIVYTNYSFPQYKERCLELGADYFFDKVSEFHRLMDCCRNR